MATIEFVRPRGVGRSTCALLIPLFDAGEAMSRRGAASGRSTYYVPWGMQIEAAAINERHALARAQNKGNARLLLAENDVPVPTPYRRTQDFKFPIIGRPHRHRQGKHFHVVRSMAEYRRCPVNLQSGYFSELFEKDQEIRVHCAHGKVLGVTKKTLHPGTIQANRDVLGETADPWTVIPWGELDQQPTYLAALSAALKAVKVMGLDFGAVDVMINTNNGRVAVCEVNTGPTLMPYLAQRYANYFNWLKRRKFRADHWEWEKFKKAKSLVWKNCQLAE